jgi:hypothetical protein
MTIGSTPAARIRLEHARRSWWNPPMWGKPFRWRQLLQAVEKVEEFLEGLVRLAPGGVQIPPPTPGLEQPKEREAWSDAFPLRGLVTLLVTLELQKPSMVLVPRWIPSRR